MNKIKDFNLYTGNHKSDLGIIDILNMLKYSLDLNNLKSKITKKLDPECNNIVIDEFTGYWSNKEINKFKNKNNLSLLVTEFINSCDVSYFGKSKTIYYFNNFHVEKKIIKWVYFITLFDFNLNKFFVGYVISSILKIIFLIPIKLLRIPQIIVSPIRSYDFFIYKFIRKILGRNKEVFKNTIFHRIFLFIIKGYSQSNPSILSKLFTKITEIHNLIYNINRFFGLQSYIRKFNNVFFSHPGQITNYKKIFPDTIFLSYFLPSFDVKDFYKNFKKEDFGFYFSGRLTKERIDMSNFFIKSFSRYFSKKVNYAYYDFSHLKKNLITKKYQFSIHPPQVKSWPFSSPTRIYRSYYNDFSIPIIFKKFGDCEIEDIALLIEYNTNFFEQIINITKNKNSYKIFERRISKYLDKANKNNFKILREICNEL